MAKTFQQNIEFAASLRFDPSQIKMLERAFGEGITPAMVKAARIGASKYTETLFKAADEINTDLQEVEKKILAAQADLHDQTKKHDHDRIRDELKVLQREWQQHKRKMRIEQAAQDKYLDRQEEAFKAYENFKVNLKVDKKQLAEDIGEALTGAFGKVSSGDLSGLASSLGSALSKGGGMMEQAGLAAGGAEAGGMAAMMTSLGPVVAGLGATVGALAAIAVVFQMAYDQSKKFNQALTEGAGSADFFSSGVGNMGASLKDARNAIVDLGIQYRMDTEEIAKFTSALNTAGVTYKEFGALAGRAATDQQAFMDVTKTAIIASKSMGIEATDAASFMDRAMRDLGKTSLTEIKDAFSMINDAAARSGMTVKSFFTAISETTSGMALHNMRLEDTIGLMTTMTKVLGEDLGKERAKMEGQFRNMGYQERIKTVLTTGKDTTSKIVRADAEAQARKGLGDPLKAAIGKVMPELIKGTGKASEVSIDKLGTMTEKEYRKVVGALYASNDQNAQVAARQLENLRGLARGAVRPGNELAQADAIGSLSKSGELAMQLASASAVLGKKGISSMEGLDRAAFEQITGQSGENLEIMKRLDRALRGQFEGLQQKVAGGGGTEEERRLAKMDFTEAIAAGFGKDTMEEGVRAGFTGMERMTERMLKETQSFSTTLKNNVAWLLEKIFSLVEWIAHLMGDDAEDAALQKQNDMIAELDAKMAQQTAYAQEYNELVRKQTTVGLDTTEKARMAELEGLAKKSEAEVAGLKAGVTEFGKYKDIRAGAGMADVARYEAEVAAGGGAEALAKAEAARAAAGDVSGRGADAAMYGLGGALAGAATGALIGSIFPGVGTAIGGGLGGLLGAAGLLGGGLGATYGYFGGDASAAQGEVEASLEGTSSVDTLVESTGLSAEYNEESKEALKQLLVESTSSNKTQGKEKALLEGLLKQMKEDSKTQALGVLKDIDAAAVTQYLTSGKKEALQSSSIMGAVSTDPAVQRALESLGVLKSKTDSPVNDFIYRGGASGGVITPINTKDEFLGMKPGGAVDRAARGGSSGTVVININGDTGTIVRVVTDVLKKAGLTPSPSNGFA